MKEPTIAPMFACMYQGLCDIARKNGYALTIHGSVTTDLDLVAIPWIEEAEEIEVLVKAMFDHLNALDYKGLLIRDCPWFTPKQINQIVSKSNEANVYHIKPHGRKSWNLYLYFGVKVDLSIMPLLK